jgi:hypothetical protein
MEILVSTFVANILFPFAINGELDVNGICETTIRPILSFESKKDNKEVSSVIFSAFIITIVTVVLLRVSLLNRIYK